MAIKIIKSERPWEQFTMLIYGEPSVGKTTLASTAIQVPDMTKVLLLSNDGGSRVVTGKEQFEGISILELSTISDYNPVYSWLIGAKASNKQIDKDVRAYLGSPDEYRTIIIDNLGLIYRRYLELVMGAFKVSRSKAEGSGLTMAWSKDQKAIATLSDYGSTRHEVYKFVTRFREACEPKGINLIFTAHANKFKSETEVSEAISPSIGGKLDFEIPGDIPMVGYMVQEGNVKKSLGGGVTGTIKRVIYFNHLDPKIRTKDHSERASRVEEPTMLRIFDLIYPDGKEAAQEKEPTQAVSTNKVLQPVKS